MRFPGIPEISFHRHDARAMAGDMGKYLSARMDGYVSKPVRVDLLRSEIDRLQNDRTMSRRWFRRKEGAHAQSDHGPQPNCLSASKMTANSSRTLVDLQGGISHPSLGLARRRRFHGWKSGRAEAHAMKGMLSNLAAKLRGLAQPPGSNSWAGIRKCPSFREACASFEILSKSSCSI